MVMCINDMLACTVETLFVEDASAKFGGLHLLYEAEAATAGLFTVRDGL